MKNKKTVGEIKYQYMDYSKLYKYFKWKQNINLKIQYQFYLNGIATSFKNIINIFDYYQT